MFIIKVFLIFSYSSVKYDAPLRPPRPSPPLPPHPDTFVGSAGVWNDPGVSLSLAAVWGVVVWSCLIYMLGFVHETNTQTHTHLYIYILYLLNRTTVGLYVKVLFKGSLPVRRHAHACLCLAPAPQCICFTVILDLNTWSPASSVNSRSKVPTTTNPLPGPSAFSLTQGQMVFNLALWFSPGERRFPL